MMWMTIDRDPLAAGVVMAMLKQDLDRVNDVRLGVRVLRADHYGVFS
jgi:hypothetical protein